MTAPMWLRWRAPTACMWGKMIWAWSRRAKWWAPGNGWAFPRIMLDNFGARCKTSADYIAVGPIFATGSKENPDPVVGVEFVRQARAMTR